MDAKIDKKRKESFEEESKKADPYFKKQQELFDCGTNSKLLLNNMDTNCEGYLSLAGETIPDSILPVARVRDRKEPIVFTDSTIFPGLHQFLHEISKEGDGITESTQKYLKTMGKAPGYEFGMSEESRTVSEFSYI